MSQTRPTTASKLDTAGVNMTSRDKPTSNGNYNQAPRDTFSHNGSLKRPNSHDGRHPRAGLADADARKRACNAPWPMAPQKPPPLNPLPGPPEGEDGMLDPEVQILERAANPSGGSMRPRPPVNTSQQKPYNKCAYRLHLAHCHALACEQHSFLDHDAILHLKHFMWHMRKPRHESAAGRRNRIAC
jgi:hypothetical protein